MFETVQQHRWMTELRRQSVLSVWSRYWERSWTKCDCLRSGHQKLVIQYNSPYWCIANVFSVQHKRWNEITICRTRWQFGLMVACWSQSINVVVLCWAWLVQEIYLDMQPVADFNLVSPSMAMVYGPHQGRRVTEYTLLSYQPLCMLRSLTEDLLTVPCCKTMFGSRRFSVAAPRVWNSLPQELQNCETLGTFRKHIKTHLFRHDII